MVEIRTIDLKGSIPGDEVGVEFLRLEIPTGKHRFSPFALVRYYYKGEEQAYGIRLDLHKKVCLDHFEDEEIEEAVQKAVPQIVEFLSSAQ